MGDNLPTVGELVAYTTLDGRVIMAKVLAVTFWDLVDLELGDGTVLRDVRRKVITHGGTAVADLGRFDRLPND